MNGPIGFAGLGDLGLPIALRIQGELGPILAWNRTSAKIDAVVAQGGRRASSPGELTNECRIVALCLTSDDAVEEIVFGPDGVLSAPIRSAGLTIVNLSTGSPDRSVGFAERAGRSGVRWLDTPVSGGVPAARDGTLTLFIGGDDEAVASAEPVLAAISRHRTHMGPVGAGQATKLCNQTIVATTLLAIAEAVATGRRRGVEVERLADALAGGFADSAPLRIFGPRMASHVFEPRLGAIGVMRKDVDLARSAAAAAGAASPVLDFAAAMYGTAGTRPGGSGNDDLATLVKMFE